MAFPYTPEFLAHLRHRYEETDEPVMSIAADLEMDEKTVYRIARHLKWRMRSERRALPRHIQLLDAAKAELTGDAPHPPPPALAGVGTLSPLALASEASSQREHFQVAAPDPRVASLHSAARQAGRGETSALDRLEQLVLKEIESEEVRRAAAGTAPLAPAETVHRTRAYSTMLQTLQTIERARNEQDAPPVNSFDPSDDIPRNIDEFRNALARRIDAFVAGRADVRHAERSGNPEVVDEAR